jgi:hypothetical protein
VAGLTLGQDGSFYGTTEGVGYNGTVFNITTNGTLLGNNYEVQYSPDLTGTNWSNLLSLSNLQTSPYQFTDPAGNGQPMRFDRVLMH